MDISLLVNSINQETGLNLKTDASKAVAFSYAGRNVLLHFDEKLEIGIVHCEVGILEQAAVSTALSTLLEANFMFSDTKGGSFSWSEHTRMVSLNFLLPLKNVGAPEFINLLNRVLMTVDEWQEKLQKINKLCLDRISKYQKDLIANKPDKAESSPAIKDSNSSPMLFI